MPDDEAAALLRGLAAELYAAAERPGAVAPRLHAWAERFEAAAQSGDPSTLVPNVEPAAHFGIRAYQAAGQATTEEVELAAVLRDKLALPSVLAAKGGETNNAELAQRVLVAEAIGGGPSNPSAPSDPTVSTEALALALVRRGAAAVALRRRLVLAVRRSRRRRRRRRWPVRVRTV